MGSGWEQHADCALEPSFGCDTMNLGLAMQPFIRFMQHRCRNINAPDIDNRHHDITLVGSDQFSSKLSTVVASDETGGIRASESSDVVVASFVKSRSSDMT